MWGTKKREIQHAAAFPSPSNLHVGQVCESHLHKNVTETVVMVITPWLQLSSNRTRLCSGTVGDHNKGKTLTLDLKFEMLNCLINQDS